MGTHPIFESDFDCLTEKRPSRTRFDSTRDIRKMKLQLLLGCALAVAANNGFHYQDENGLGVLLCGKCKQQANQHAVGECFFKTGRCKFGCIPGWQGVTKGDENNISAESGSRCDEPICDEGLCGDQGKCVAPNQCVCTKLTSKYDILDENTGEVLKTGCYQLRVWGLIGAAASLVIVSVAITLCHCIQSARTKKGM